MERYVTLLNDLNAVGRVDLGWIERYWIACVQQFFAAKLFTLKIDHARSLRSIVSDILRQALNRQREMTGVPYAGAVLQHLVGAKLELMLESEKVTHKAFVRRIRHHSVSTADLQSGRSGDFVIGTSSIHVTTAPSEALIDRCQDNLNSGVRPIIVTMKRQVRVAEGLSENRGIASRIDIFEIEQFIAANLYEIGGFDAIRRDIAIQELVNRYNTIVDNVETDPSIRIALRPVRMR